ncbi:MAG: hypothetical protein HRT61_23410, partial [Ekhidna sp.]|nr:hypothetical protein [Ekhidna sp.]
MNTIARKLKMPLWLLIVTSMHVLQAQSDVADFASDVEKIKVKLDMPLEGRAYKNGTGYTLNPKMLDKLPEKVALVSFYVFDPGYTKTTTSSMTSGNIKYTTTT